MGFSLFLIVDSLVLQDKLKNIRETNHVNLSNYHHDSLDIYKLIEFVRVQFLMYWWQQ